MNKKTKLPPPWEIRVSKTYPDRVFYYNAQTNVRTWEMPEVKTENENTSNKNTITSSVLSSKDKNTCSITKLKQTIKLLESEKDSDIKRKLYQDKSEQKKTPMEMPVSNNNNEKERKADCKIIITENRNINAIQIRSQLLKKKLEESKCASSKPNLSLNPMHSKKSNAIVEKDYKAQPKVTKRISRIPPSVPKADELRCVNQSGKLKKNLANRRLKNLRQKLSLEIEKEKEKEKERELELEIIDPAKTTQSVPSMDVEWNVLPKSKNLHQLVKDNVQEHFSKYNKSIDKNNSFPKSIIKECLDSVLDEEMDWEPIQEEKILTEVFEVRQQVYTLQNSTNSLPKNQFQLSTVQEKKHIYIVVDTNVFLINLSKVEELLNTEFANYGRPFIIVPWTVIQELDVIKDSTSKPESLRTKARSAISFLHQHFSKKHPRILGQTAEDAYQNKSTYEAENSDDLIWQTCLQIKSHHPHVVLFTYDKNLQNKALIHKIKSIGKENSLETIDVVVNNAIGNHFLLNKKETVESDNILQREALLVEDVFSKVQDLVLAIISEILTVESLAVFGDNWSKYMKVKPPWTVISALKCAELHWIAITSEAFRNRKAETNIKKLYELLKKDAGELKLKNILQLLENINELAQMLDVNKYLNLIEKTHIQIDELRDICKEVDKKLSEFKLEEQINLVQDVEEAKKRAQIGWKIFEVVYVYYRDTSAAFLRRFGLPCPFPADVISHAESFYTRERHIDLTNILNTLLHILKAVLEDMSHQQINYQNIIQLYDTLITVPIITDATVTPVDVYYCIKYNEAMIRTGVSQYEEIFSQLRILTNSTFM